MSKTRFFLISIFSVIVVSTGIWINHVSEKSIVNQDVKSNIPSVDNKTQNIGIHHDASTLTISPNKSKKDQASGVQVELEDSTSSGDLQTTHSHDINADDISQSGLEVPRSNNSHRPKDSITKGVKVIGETTVTLPIRDLTTGKNTKEIKLLKIDLSDEYLNDMEKRAESIDRDNGIDDSDTKIMAADNANEFNSRINSQDASIPNFSPNDFKVNLGMNNVPVLDQGQAGTCVTFASTAVIDAKLMSGDLISQQCLLELGVYLEKNNWLEYSGWAGLSSNVIALDRMKNYGVVDNYACPHKYSAYQRADMMSPNEYKNHRYNLGSNQIAWKKMNNANDLVLLKSALDKGNRVLIATALDMDIQLGYPVNSASMGLWKLPKDITAKAYFDRLKVNQKLGGHAVIITAYDDQKQLLKIRNSWGTTAGEHGEFYMTFDYYRLMNWEAIEILN